MYILSIVNAIKKITIKELKDFTYESYYRRMGFLKENSYYSIKHQKKKVLLLATKIIENLSDATNAKQYDQS